MPPKADDSDKDEEEKKDPDDDLPDPVNNGGFAERYFWT